MIIINQNNHYVVQRPEFGVYQDINPATGQPFASEAEAQAWDDSFMSHLAATNAATADAEKKVKEAIRIITVTADKQIAQVGETITVTATVKNGLDAVVPLNDSFAVPVENEVGEVALIKLAAFVAGKAVVSLKPARSGYYNITERGINQKLPEGMRFNLPVPLSVTVYE